MKNESVTVGGKYKRDIERRRVIEGLLHSVAYTVVVVFCFDDSYWNIGLVIKDVVGAFGFAASDELAAHDDAAFGEGYLLANLNHPVPARVLDGGAYELGTDVALAEVFLVHLVRLSRLSTNLRMPG